MRTYDNHALISTSGFIITKNGTILIDPGASSQGAAHFAGDAVIWLSGQKILFSGDLVFLERMLSVLPYSNAVAWQKSFKILETLKPIHKVPGHGHPGNLDDARKDTGSYLDWLVKRVKPEVENWTPLDEVVEKFKEAPFRHLQNFELLHSMNVNRTYLQIEGGN